MSEIFLWGPPGSGKTWMLAAFERKIEMLNKLYVSKESRYRLSLKDISTGDPATQDEAPEISPTPGMDWKHYLFKRTAGMHDFAGQVSSHTHRMLVYDNQGAAVVGLEPERISETAASAAPNAEASVTATDTNSVDGEGMQDALTIDEPNPHSTDEAEEEYQKAVDAAKIQLEHSESIILLLDVGTGSAGSVDAFVNALKSFRNTIQDMDGVEGRSKKRRIAACFGKADDPVLGKNLAFATEDARIEPLIARRFGSAAKTEIMRILKEDLVSHSVELFSFSSVGYLRNNEGKIVPNIDRDQKLLDFENWLPVNVVKPFFWLFEEIERQRLLDNSVNEKGAFYWFFGRTLPRRNQNDSGQAQSNRIGEARIKEYIDYETMVRKASQLTRNIGISYETN